MLKSDNSESDSEANTNRFNLNIFMCLSLIGLAFKRKQ